MRLLLSLMWALVVVSAAHAENLVSGLPLRDAGQSLVPKVPQIQADGSGICTDCFVEVLMPQVAPVQANTLTWDYVSPVDVICSSTASTDCIEFQLLYESAPGVFTATVSGITSSACVPKTSGGVTCTVSVPTITGEKYKPHTWVARAVSKDGVPSANSNTLAVFREPAAPGNLRPTN